MYRALNVCPWGLTPRGAAQRRHAGVLRLDRLAVMVVDNNRHMLNLIAAILRGLNIRNVVTLTNAVDAFKEMRTFSFDLVISDQVMEPICGIEFTQLLRTSQDSPPARRITRQL